MEPALPPDKVLTALGTAAGLIGGFFYWLAKQKKLHKSIRATEEVAPAADPVADPVGDRSSYEKRHRANEEGFFDDVFSQTEPYIKKHGEAATGMYTVAVGPGDKSYVKNGTLRGFPVFFDGIHSTDVLPNSDPRLHPADRLPAIYSKAPKLKQ